jgi:2-polyprenyl-3-methyl-5-hydroxy-6-metoxy-1,4-benzoquinol methylase
VEKIHISECPVCTVNNAKKVFDCNDFLVSNEKFTLFCCKNCGFTFTQDFPSQSEIGRYYDAPEYVSHSDTQRGVINFLYHFVRKIALRSKVKLVENQSFVQKGNILDIGAGTGYFLNAMKRAGWTVSGIEKSDSARAFAYKKFGLNFDAGHLRQTADNLLSAVTLWHVLEHLENLNDTLDSIYQILKPDGVLIIALPNKNSADARHYREFWAAYDVPRHLWHFSPSNLQQLAENHNFTITKIKPMFFDPFYISMLSEKHKNTPAATFVGLIKGAIFTIQSILNKNNCSSLIYILKKR